MLRNSLEFGGGEVLIESAQGPSELLDVLPLLIDPSDFYGDTNVDHIVHFGDVFRPLIGEFSDPEGVWQDNTLADRGVVILERYYAEAKRLMDSIDGLAQRLVADGRLYDDAAFAADYLDLTRRGYDLLTEHEAEFELGTQGAIPVSLERAGLVTTRIAQGLGLDAEVDSEVRVVTKRTHLAGDPSSFLTVTVQWRDRADAMRTVDQAVLLTDFVNPASGASASAYLLANEVLAGPPKTVAHRSVSATQQGVLFVQAALAQRGVASTFYSVGEARVLNDHYYLAGDRAVGDAGHVLRHFLPAWYAK